MNAKSAAPAPAKKVAKKEAAAPAAKRICLFAYCSSSQQQKNWAGAVPAKKALRAPKKTIKKMRVAFPVGDGDTATLAALPPIELCPTSNEATLGLLEKGGLAKHPSMGAWLARGVRVAVSTDDPGVFACTLSGEYAKVAAAFGLGRAQVAALARAAFEHAFLPAAERRALLEALPPVEAEGGFSDV